MTTWGRCTEVSAIYVKLKEKQESIGEKAAFLASIDANNTKQTQTAENTPMRSDIIDKEASIPIVVSNPTIKLQGDNTRIILEYIFHEFGHWNNINLDNKVTVEWFGPLRSKTNWIQGPQQALKSKLREL